MAGCALVPICLSTWATHFAKKHFPSIAFLTKKGPLWEANMSMVSCSNPFRHLLHWNRMNQPSRYHAYSMTIYSTSTMKWQIYGSIFDDERGSNCYFSLVGTQLKSPYYTPPQVSSMGFSRPIDYSAMYQFQQGSTLRCISEWVLSYDVYTFSNTNLSRSKFLCTVTPWFDLWPLASCHIWVVVTTILLNISLVGTEGPLRLRSVKHHKLNHWKWT